MREGWLGQQKIHAECRTCGKEWDGDNAHGVGARHSQVYGHHVVIEKLQYFHYGYKKEQTNETDKE